MVDLGTPAGCEFGEARDINNSGQIVGTAMGFDSGLNTVGFMLTVVPEPSTGLLAALCLAGILCCFRRRR